MSWAKYSRFSRKLMVSGTLTAIAMIALFVGTQQNAVEAASIPAENLGGTSFPGAGFGAIPDGPAEGTVCGDYGAPRDITFTVAGVTAPLTDVEVSVTGTHSWVADLEISLIAPNGASKILLKGTGAAAADGCGDNSDFGGPYVFFDAAPATPTFWTAAGTAGAALPVAAGSYRATLPLTGAVTTITPAFAGVANPNGTWTLRVRDGGEGDTGSISAASLTLTGTSGPTTQQHVVDFNGDARTDFAVVRNTGGGPNGQITWFVNTNGPGTTSQAAWGTASDSFIPADFDGDDKTDIAVWRPAAAGTAGFYILRSSDSAFQFELFGQSGDQPSVTGDYDGDGKADAAVYRAGAASGDQSTWFYRGTLNNPGGNITFVPWGLNGDFEAPGDYDGDGRNDFVVQRNNGGGQARFWMSQTTAGFSSIVFGTPTDVILPGDYDGDGKTDLATVRGIGGNIHWFVRPSSTGVINGGPTAIFGNSATDFPTQGDYDGDGKTDFAVWRPNADPTQNYFFVLGSTAGYGQSEWGQNGDYPVANYNAH